MCFSDDANLDVCCNLLDAKANLKRSGLHCPLLVWICEILPPVVDNYLHEGGNAVNGSHGEQIN